jgi:hypothetical protein
MASWYKECQEGLWKYQDERAELCDLVWKMTNREGASSSQGSAFEVEQLCHSLATKENELFDSLRRCIELKLANVQLLNRADDTDRKNREPIKHVERWMQGFSS